MITHNGVVDTRITELEMDVYSNDVIQKAKCRARKIPAVREYIQSLICRFRKWGMYFKIIIGARIKEAITKRAAAMKIDDAPFDRARRIKMAPVEEAKTPMKR
jgi:hypothetical protein